MSVFGGQLLAGKHAFVMGGTSGINLGIARRLAQAGARLSVLGRNAERGQRALQVLHDAGGEAAFYQADVRRDFAAVERALREAVDRFGRLDILVTARPATSRARAGHVLQWLSGGGGHRPGGHLQQLPGRL